MTVEQASRRGWWWVGAIVVAMAGGAWWLISSGTLGGGEESTAQLVGRAEEIATPPLERLGRGTEVLESEAGATPESSESGSPSDDPAARQGEGAEHQVILGLVLNAIDRQPVPNATVVLLRRPPAQTLADLVQWEQFRPGEDTFPGEAQVRGDDGLERMSPPPPKDAPKTTTDAQGHFELAVSGSGSYYLAAEARGLYQRDFASIDVANAEAPRVQLRLYPAAIVTGRVVNRRGQGVAGARVLCGDQFDPMSFATGSQVPMRSFETETDREGHFTFAAIPPVGAKYLKIEARTYAKLVKAGWTCRPGGTVEHDLVLPRGGTIHGRVLANGEPVTAANVEAVRKGVSAFDVVGRIESTRKTKTVPDGSFEIPRLAEGEYRVQVDAPGWLPSEVKKVDVTEEGDVQVDFEVEAGEHIAGIVLDARGKPIGGARVVPVRKRGLLDLSGIERDIRLRKVGTTRSDDTGLFACRGLIAGTYSLEVTADRHADLKLEDIEAGTEGLVIRLPLPGAIAGAVILGDPLEPAEEFSIEIPLGVDSPMATVELPGRTEQFHAAGGRFLLEDVEPGTVSLKFRAEGYVSARVEEVVVVAGETTSGIRVVLTRGAGLAGRVLTTDGEPIGGVRLTTKTGMERFMAVFDKQDSTVSDEDGHFEMTGLEAGMLTVSITHPDFAGTSLRQRLSAGEVVDDLEIRLSRGATVEGRVFDLEGQPAKGIMVFATIPGRMDFKQSTTDEEGAFVLTGLSSGSYQVSAMLGSAESPEDIMAAISGQVSQAVELEEDEVEYVELRAATTEGARLSGVVTQAGQPLEGGLIMVTAVGKQQPSASGMIGEKGRFEVLGLAPGDYQVVVQGGPGLGDFVPFELKISEEDSSVERDFDLPGGEVFGRVVSAETRQPLSGVRVLARDAGGDAVAAAGLKQALTDGKGEFRFRSLQPGRYDIVVGGTGFVGRGDVGHEIVEGVTVTGAATDVGEVRLPSGGSFSGRVTNAAGESLAGVLVGLEDDRGRTVLLPGEVPLDEGGRFTIKGLAAGTYTIRVYLSNGESQRQGGVRVQPGSEASEVRVIVRGQ